ncbi:MAG: TonB-dependent receptor, partial [Bacteroidota bacterium]
MIDDRLSEWTYLDSAGYNQPRPPDSIGYQFPDLQPDREIILTDVIKAQNTVSSNRITAYLQDTYTLKDEKEHEWSFNLGGRLHYWDFNNQLVGGPRAQIAFRPHWVMDQEENGDSTNIMVRNVTFRLSGGMYYQPPFYREMRGIFGEINQDIRAQQAIHAVFGVDYIFRARNRPFKFSGEIYYKDLNQLIPYEVENVRLRYYATNNSNGYATGLDLMLNGEFVPGVQSWIRASVLRTEEDLTDDFFFEYFNDEGELIRPGFTLNDTPVDSNRVEPGFIPRPSDQLFSFSLLFQDEMKRWPEYKVLMSIFYGSPLPFGPPTFERYLDTERTAAYRRVDVGFSRDLVTKEDHERKKFKWLKSGSISLEVFNLLGINNTINYTWI